MKHPTDAGTACCCQTVFQSPRSKLPWKHTHQTHTAIEPQGCNTDLCVSQASIYLCILMRRGKEKQVFFREHNFCEPLTHKSVGLQKSTELLIPTVSPPSGYCKLELQKTQPQHLMRTEKMSKYSQKRERAYDLGAWLTSSTRALCC